MRSHFNWESGFNIPYILGEIAACRNIGKDDRVSFNAGPYHFWLPVLKSAVRASKDAGQLKDRCVESAVNDRNITLKDSEAFLRRCDAAYDQLSSRQKKRYVVISSVTYKGTPPYSNAVDGDTILQWQPSPNSKFMRAAKKERLGLQGLQTQHNLAEEPADLTSIIAKVSAFDPHDAVTIAIDSLDTLRGMLNLLVNSNRGINPFARLARPHAINRFRNGPYRTVHNADGSLAIEMFWYEHRWLHETPTIKFKDENTKKFNKNLKGWWKKLQQNPLADHIKQGLLRYCRALDQHDAEPALLGMWGALESLTGTQREKYDVTVSRTSRLFMDREAAKQIAHHIRLRRNSTIHAARTLEVDEADAILLQAESLVSRVLFFCLNEGKRFANPQELFSFLELSPDKDKLKRSIALSKFFLEYQARKPHRTKPMP